MVRRISRLSDLPLRALVLPDALESHAANHELFVAAGVAVIAQEKALRRLVVGAAAAAAASGVAVSAPANAAGRQPGALIGFGRRHDLRLGGVEVQLHHFGAAHSDGDVAVLFPDKGVVALGQLVSPSAPWLRTVRGPMNDIGATSWMRCMPSGRPRKATAGVCVDARCTYRLNARSDAVIARGGRAD